MDWETGSSDWVGVSFVGGRRREGGTYVGCCGVDAAELGGVLGGGRLVGGYEVEG